MTAPPSTGTWLYRLRWPLFLAAFGIYAFLHGRYETYRTKRDYAERVRDAQRYLEASNPARRRAGLWPITAGFSERTYAEDYHGLNVSTIKLSAPSHSYQPRPMVKLVGYDSKRRQLLWEKETICFTIIQSDDSLDYVLHRAFSYQAAQATSQGRNA